MNKKISNESKRLSLFMDKFETGGAQRVQIYLSKELASRGHDVELVVLSGQGSLREYVDPRVNIVDLKGPTMGGPTFAFALGSFFKSLSYLRKRSPDGVLSTITGVNLICVLAWNVTGRPGRLILCEATSLKNLSSKIRFFLMAVLYRFSSRIVALTSVHADELKKKLHLPSRLLRVIGNPIDKNSESLKITSDDESVAQVFQPYVLSVGRLVRAKNYSSLIRAYYSLQKNECLPKLVIVGDGPERLSLEKLIKDLSLENHVILMGNQSRPAAWYANAQGFIMTSLWEGYPVAFLEAVYFKLPIAISVYDNSIKEIVNDLGLKKVCFFNALDLQDIVRALRELVSQKSGENIELNSDFIIDSYEDLLINESYR